MIPVARTQLFRPAYGIVHPLKKNLSPAVLRSDKINMIGPETARNQQRLAEVAVLKKTGNFLLLPIFRKKENPEACKNGQILEEIVTI